MRITTPKNRGVSIVCDERVKCVEGRERDRKARGNVGDELLWVREAGAEMR